MNLQSTNLQRSNFVGENVDTQEADQSGVVTPKDDGSGQTDVEEKNSRRNLLRGNEKLFRQKCEVDDARRLQQVDVDFVSNQLEQEVAGESQANAND